jgi:hypothetical protein
MEVCGRFGLLAKISLFGAQDAIARLQDRKRAMKRAFAVSAVVLAIGIATQACSPGPQRAEANAASDVSPDAASDVSPSAASDINPAALSALERMTLHLGTLKMFEVSTRSTIDQVMDDGQKLQFEGSATYKVKRPDAFFIGLHSDRRIREFYYNGKTFTMFSPRMKLFTEVSAPPTIAEMVGVLEDDYDITLPLVDLFRWGAEPEDMKALTSAEYVGPGRVGDVECDHYAFRQENVDWQVWIQRGDAPLPRKLVITTQDDPAFPQFIAVLDWKSDARFDASTFSFKPSASTYKIALAKATDARR